MITGQRSVAVPTHDVDDVGYVIAGAGFVEDKGQW
jgi:hypothetical protein